MRIRVIPRFLGVFFHRFDVLVYTAGIYTEMFVQFEAFSIWVILLWNFGVFCIVKGTVVC